MVMHIATRAVLALILLAALDFAWQRHRHEKSLRMSKEEVKQEAARATSRRRCARRSAAASSRRRAAG